MAQRDRAEVYLFWEVVGIDCRVRIKGHQQILTNAVDSNRVLDFNDYFLHLKCAIYLEDIVRNVIIILWCNEIDRYLHMFSWNNAAFWFLVRDLPTVSVYWSDYVEVCSGIRRIYNFYFLLRRPLNSLSGEI